MTAAAKIPQEGTVVTIVPDLTKCPCCGQPRPSNRVLEIAVEVARERYGATLRALRSPDRSERLVIARALVVWALRTFGRGQSYQAIGRILNRSDHSTTINLHRKAVAARLCDPSFEGACAAIAFRMRDDDEEF